MILNPRAQESENFSRLFYDTVRAFRWPTSSMVTSESRL